MLPSPDSWLISGGTSTAFRYVQVCSLNRSCSQLQAMIRTNAASTFTQHARAYTASLARELELGDILESATRTIMFLDGGVEGGGCVYAAVEFNGRLLGSSVIETPAWVQSRGDDVAFFKSPDTTYAVSIPIRRDGAAGALYLGFDKQPMLAQLRSARNQIGLALVAFGIASVAAAVLLARLVALPLTQLRTASRKVAQGDSTAHLSTHSKMVRIASRRDGDPGGSNSVDVCGVYSFAELLHIRICQDAHGVVIAGKLSEDQLQIVDIRPTAVVANVRAHGFPF